MRCISESRMPAFCLSLGKKGGAALATPSPCPARPGPLPPLPTSVRMHTHTSLVERRLVNFRAGRSPTSMTREGMMWGSTGNKWQTQHGRKSSGLGAVPASPPASASKPSFRQSSIRFSEARRQRRYPTS